MKEADSFDDDDYDDVIATTEMVDAEDEAEERRRIIELRKNPTRIKITGIKLDQMKMMKRKL